MPRGSGIQPSRRIAKALTGVFAPGPAASYGGPRRQGIFSPLGGPAQFAPGPGEEFCGEQPLPGTAAAIAGAEPHEVEEFVDEDAREFGACAVERDAALAQERSGMNRAASVPQAGSSFDADGRAG